MKASIDSPYMVWCIPLFPYWSYECFMTHKLGFFFFHSFLYFLFGSSLSSNFPYGLTSMLEHTSNMLSRVSIRRFMWWLISKTHYYTLEKISFDTSQGFSIYFFGHMWDFKTFYLNQHISLENYNKIPKATYSDTNMIPTVTCILHWIVHHNKFDKIIHKIWNLNWQGI